MVKGITMISNKAKNYIDFYTKVVGIPVEELITDIQDIKTDDQLNEYLIKDLAKKQKPIDPEIKAVLNDVLNEMGREA